MTTPNKNTAVATVAKPSALNLMAARMSVEPAKLFDTLKATVFKNATNEELLALTVVANTYDLNPFLKEIYAFPAKGGGITPIVSVDGWNKMLVNQPDFDGMEFEFEEGEDGKPYSCTATIYIKNRSKPVKITEYFSECNRNTEPWKTMPRRMLRNRTLCQASRMAFGFSGVKHEEEADAIAVEAVITSVPAEPPPHGKVLAAPTTQENPPTVTQPPSQPVAGLQKELETFCVTNGFTFSHLQKWGEESGNIEGASSMASFDEVPSEICKRLLRAKNGLLAGLSQTKVD